MNGYRFTSRLINADYIINHRDNQTDFLSICQMVFGAFDSNVLEYRELFEIEDSAA